jgi:hypothetical protein
MIQEYERAILTRGLPEYGLKSGDIGTVVHVYQQGAAYEIEFFALDGRTLEVVTGEADQVRPVGHRDMLHVRELTVN